jgi:ribosomal protein L37E
MIIRACKECGVTCWHNPLKKAPQQEQQYRCTFCGFPAGSKGDKHDWAVKEMIKQRTRALLLKITSMGRV